MRVDFDPDQERLCFSRDAAASAAASCGGEPPSSFELERAARGSAYGWRARLYAQARPLQIHLLRRFGEEAATVCPPPTAAGEAGASNAILGSAPSANGSSKPRCVCGQSLACTNIRDRVLAFVSEGSPFLPAPSQLEALMLNPPVVCDICGRPVRSSRVWSCENGRRTVLHASAYDVCEPCFALHAYGEEAAEESGSAFGEDDSWADGDSD